MPNHDGSNLVFLVGAPRSGTTWLQRMLASHPRIVTGQESGLFDTYIGPQIRAFRRDLDPEISGRGCLGLGCYFTEKEFKTLLEEYLQRILHVMLAPVGNGQLFLEKTPSHALYLQELVEFLPKSRILHLVRDGRDVAASLLAAARSWGRNWAPNSAAAAATMWKRHVEAVIAAKKTLPENSFLEIRYESLVDDPPGTLATIFSFLGLATLEGEIEEYVLVNNRCAAQNGSWTPIPVSGEALIQGFSSCQEPRGFVAPAPEPWEKRLSAAELHEILAVAGGLLEELGYLGTQKKLCNSR